MTYHLYITARNYSSWSLRPWLLLRELDIPFVEEIQPLVSGSFRQPQWFSFSPVAHVPCLHVVDDSVPDQKPLVLWESLAIVEHLAESHPDKHVYPADRAARAWARSAVCEMHAGFATIRQEMGMNIGVRVQLLPEAFNPSLLSDLARIDALWTEGLTRFGGPYLAGPQFTAVDAFYAPVVLRLQTYLGPKERLGEKARGYAERMLEVPGIKEWLKKDSEGKTPK
ncbi:hypothetical protein N0V88_002348 [Collariella sp. IMI 366227]|nr:hypothetical protein N0V88_002348 [Collariella sp. IMI 366227]